MRINRFAIAAAALIVPFLLMTACSKKDATGMAAAEPHAPRYHCAMHPQYTSDKPGDCPICNMRLVEIDGGEPVASAGGDHKVKYYRNPMNPAVHSAVPMKDPMGMDYLPVYDEDISSAPAVAGQGTVKMAAGSEQRIGVTVSRVEMRDLFVTIKAPSRVAYDPNLYSAILEYQEALKGHGSGSEENKTESNMTVRASKLRLRQMGLSDQQVEDVSRPGFDPSNLLLGRAGEKIWIYVDIYDYEAGVVKPGQTAEFTSPALSGQRLEGKVKSVDAIVNSETRTLRVRVEVPNPNGILKPEMYLSATILAGIGKKLAVPESAVLDTGVRQLAYVQTAPGQFEPREIRIGREASGYFEVVSGLKDGEQVVTSANFLIDSESKIRAATQNGK